MAKQIVWTKRANIKFNRVVEYLEKNWGEGVTRSFVKQTYSIVELLSEQPELGTVEDSELSIRGFLITKHNRMFYRVTERDLIILNFFDTRQNPAKKS